MKRFPVLLAREGFLPPVRPRLPGVPMPVSAKKRQFRPGLSLSRQGIVGARAGLSAILRARIQDFGKFVTTSGSVSSAYSQSQSRQDPSLRTAIPLVYSVWFAAMLVGAVVATVPR